MIESGNISRKDERKVHHWDERVQGKVVRKLTAVNPLSRPAVWLDGRPVASDHIGAYQVEWKPWTQDYPWMKKVGRGKIHVRFRIGGHGIHIVLDDQWPIGILHCRVDGTELLGLGNCFVREMDGQVFLNMELWDRNRLRKDRRRRSLVVSAFGIGWDHV